MRVGALTDSLGSTEVVSVGLNAGTLVFHPLAGLAVGGSTALSVAETAVSYWRVGAEPCSNNFFIF